MEQIAKRRTAHCDLVCPEEIVVATDLIDAERLVPYAVTQAQLSAASLTFVHAMPPDETAEAKSGAPLPAGRVNISSSKIDTLEDIAKQVRAQGVFCSTIVNSGPVADVVTEIVHRTGAGRLIVGTHARHGVDKLLLGSVARKLLETVDVPVFIVGPQCRQESPRWSIKRILLATSSLNKTTPKMIVARAIAKQCDAELTVLHVLTSESRVSRQHRPPHEPTGTLPDGECGGTGQSGLARVTAGDPAVEIVRVANEIPADLIVVGVHHYPFRLPFSKETTVYKVLASAPCPVLTLKSDSALIRKHAFTETRHSAVL